MEAKTCSKCGWHKPVSEFYDNDRACKSCRCAIMRAKKNYIERNPDKRAAHIAVGNAVRDGVLHKKACQICGKSEVHAHHDDYGEPLKVKWLCAKHHKQLHMDIQAYKK